MSKELKDLANKLESMNINEINEYIDKHYDDGLYGTKDEMIKKIIRHEATKPNDKYREKSLSESYCGSVTKIDDIGQFINDAISEFRKSNRTPISKILIEINEDLGELVFVRGYKINVVNIDIHHSTEVI